MVKHAYQGTGLLKQAVTLRNNVVGDTYKFRKMGKGLANQKASSAEVVAMNWNAPEFTDIFDQQTVNFDEKQELASTIANALGRRCDQLVIDAMDGAGAYAATVGTGVGGTASNLNMAKIIKAQVSLRQKGVPNSELFAAINALGLGGLLNDEKSSSVDYQNVKALVNGEVDTLAGFKFVILEDRAEGGLTAAGNVVDSYFFARPSVGLAIGIDMKTDIDYVPERTSWLCNGMLKAGAVARDTDGIVKVQYTQTA
jgi:hypothetical protein